MSTELKCAIDNLSWDAYNYYYKNILIKNQAYAVEENANSGGYEEYFHSDKKKKRASTNLDVIAV